LFAAGETKVTLETIDNYKASLVGARMTDELRALVSIVEKEAFDTWEK